MINILMGFLKEVCEESQCWSVLHTCIRCKRGSKYDWVLGRGGRRGRGQVVLSVRHSLHAHHRAQLPQAVPGVPGARQVGNDHIQLINIIVCSTLQSRACYLK